MPLEPNELTTAIIDKAIRRSRIRRLHRTSNINTLPGAEGQLPFPERTPDPFFYLILTFEQTNQTPYLKPIHLSTAIFYQAILRSRIRKPHLSTNIKPQTGEEGPFVGSPFSIFKSNNLSTAIINLAILRSRIRQPHTPTNIKPQPREEGPFFGSPYVLFKKDYLTLSLSHPDT